MKKGILVGFLLSVITLHSKADYTDSCHLYTQIFSNSASIYSEAKSAYDIEKSHYESACDKSYGYAKDLAAACGEYSDITAAYVESDFQLNTAKVSFNSDFNNVATFCGIPDAFEQTYIKQSNKLKSTITELEKRIRALEAENDLLKKQ